MAIMTRELQNNLIKEYYKNMGIKIGDKVGVIINATVCRGVIIGNPNENGEYEVEYYIDGSYLRAWILEIDIKLIEKSSQESKPKHYQTDSIDVIDFCNIYNLSFSLGNVVKYVCRAGKKENESTLKDLNKAKDYIEREIKFLEG